MTDAGIRLRDLVEFDESDVVKALAARAQDEREPERLGERVAGLAARVGAQKLNDALDADVFELLLTAWTKAKAVRDCADPAKHPPGTAVVLPLAKPRLSATYHPVLEIALAGHSLPLRFTLKLELALETAALAIEGGMIRSIAPGDAAVSAVLEYGAIRLKECRSRRVQLPGEIRLDPGLRIPA